MHDWLAARAAATPHKIAYHARFVGTQTFGELNNKADFYVAYLQARDFQPGDRIGVLLENVHEHVHLIFAVMRLQMVLVPINTRLSAGEIRWQLENTNCICLISAHQNLRSIREMIAELGIPVLCVNITAEVGPHVDYLRTTSHKYIQPSKLLRPEIDLDKPFAIIHSSGTSGKPKGAVLTYGNLYHSAIASAFRMGVHPDDNWLCVLPLYHVSGLSIVIRSVLYGTMFTMLLKRDVETMNRILTKQPITLVSLVPTMLYRLLEAKKHAWKPKLRLVLLGGAAPSNELVEHCVAENIPIATTYGLTEAASQVATALPEQIIRKPGSVGKPLMFTSVDIQDDDGRPVGTGTYGEIVVKGPTVFSGYYNHPDATNKTLHNNELHTGDIGYLDEEGDLWIVQRRSDLIVSGGENVYPAEVETVLRQHPQVDEAVVFGVDDAEWGQRVAAVIQSDEPPTENEIKSFVRQRLAGHKLPRTLHFVEKLPLTASGKINRNKIKISFS